MRNASVTLAGSTGRHPDPSGVVNEAGRMRIEKARPPRNPRRIREKYVCSFPPFPLDRTVRERAKGRAYGQSCVSQAAGKMAGRDEK